MLDIYEYCEKKWKLTSEQIQRIEQKRTYKNFVNITVFWKKNGISGSYKIKIIKKEGVFNESY